MPAAASMTYSSLTEDIITYSERSDDTFTAQIPRFIMNAENRIATEARGLGFIQTVGGSLAAGTPNGQVLQKPARWRQNISLTIGVGAEVAPSVAPYNRRVSLKLRPYEYCRSYWPDSTQTDQPVYYADWTWENVLIAPTPDAAYPFEWLYHERPQPLSTASQTNWTTQYAPQLILYACLLETAPWLKRTDQLQVFQAQYQEALKQVQYEAELQLMDRGMQQLYGK